MAHFILAGSNPADPQATNIKNGCSLHVKSASVHGDSGFGGHITLGNTTFLDVNVTDNGGVWTLNPTSLLTVNGYGNWQGSPAVEQGSIEVLKNQLTILTPLQLDPTSLVTVSTFAAIEFQAPVTYHGGVITSVNGQLDDSNVAQPTTATVSGHQQITIGGFVWDPATSRILRPR